MSAIATQILPLTPYNKVKRPISLETYNRQYADKDDGYRYEWNNGIIEKTPRLSMNRSQLRIAQILNRAFTTTHAYKMMGELAWEVVMFLPTANRNRIADLAFLTAEQVKEQEDLRPSISPFVVEIISKNDTADEIQIKLQEYFDNGIKVVWQIFKNQKAVHVYTSPVEVKICKGTTLCSASPALPDFNIAAQIFA